MCLLTVLVYVRSRACVADIKCDLSLNCFQMQSVRLRIARISSPWLRVLGSELHVAQSVRLRTMVGEVRRLALDGRLYTRPEYLAYYGGSAGERLWDDAGCRSWEAYSLRARAEEWDYPEWHAIRRLDMDRVALLQHVLSQETVGGVFVGGGSEEGRFFVRGAPFCVIMDYVHGCNSSFWGTYHAIAQVNCPDLGISECDVPCALLVSCTGWLMKRLHRFIIRWRRWTKDRRIFVCWVLVQLQRRCSPRSLGSIHTAQSAISDGGAGNERRTRMGPFSLQGPWRRIASYLH